MRSRSDTWKKITVRGKFTFETKTVIGEKEYFAISAPKISRSLMNSPLQVGNCNSATLSVSILTDDVIPPSSKAVIKGRVTDGQGTYSEWLNFGTFYIDQRDTSYAGLVTISCYDAMLKANQMYLSATDTELVWPKDMVTVVNEIAARIGVKLDSRTVLKQGAAYMVPFPKGLTMMQVLGYIGGCNGGNWIITEDNLLRLVPFVTIPDETYYIIDYDYQRIKTTDGYLLVHKESNDQAEDVVEDFLNIPIVLGTITNGAPVTVTAVTGSDNESNSFIAGDTTAGVTLNIGSNPYITQEIIDDLYADFKGLIYEPYTATKTIYDPAAELGDKIKIGEYVHSVIYNTNMKFDLDFLSDLSAPNSEELTSEYPYLSELEKLKQSTENFTKNVNESTEALTKEIEENKSDVEKVSEALTSEVIRAGKAETALYEQLSAETNRAEKAENDLDERITSLENTQSGTITADLNELKKSVKSNAEATASLKESVDSQGETLTGLQEKVNAQGETIEAIKQVNDTQTEQITGLQESVNTQKITLDEHTNSLASIKESLKEQNTELTAVKKMAQQNSSDIAKMQDTLTEHTGQFVTINEKLDAILAKLSNDSNDGVEE